MIAEVDEIFPVFVLRGSTIRKVVNLHFTRKKAA
jgi:hypothetical protein